MAAASHSTPTSFAPNVHANNTGSGANGNNNLNINSSDNNGVLRLEVELRDKNVRRRPNQQQRTKGYAADRNQAAVAGVNRKQPAPLSSQPLANTDNYFVPMEKVSESFHSSFLVLLHTHTHKSKKERQNRVSQTCIATAATTACMHCVACRYRWSFTFYFRLTSIYLILFWLFILFVLFYGCLCTVSVELLFGS